MVYPCSQRIDISSCTGPGQAKSSISAVTMNVGAVPMCGTLFATLTGGVLSVWTSVLINCALSIFALLGQFWTPKEINRIVKAANNDQEKNVKASV